MLGTTLLILLQPPNNPRLIRWSQELRLVREIKDHPETRDTDEHGSQTLENEDPRPPCLPTNPLHLTNRSSQQTTKRPAHRRSGEEDGSADTELAPLVPATEVVIDTREQARLRQPKKEPSGHHALEVVAKTHSHHADTPEDHNDGDEDGRAKTLEKNIGEGFGERVGDEENGEAGIVLATGDSEGFLEADDAGIADVGAVEEGD